jgi:hypothetical protein
MYENEEDYEGVNHFFGDDCNEQSASQKAQKMAEIMKERNLQAIEL